MGIARPLAGVVELADTLGSNPSGETRVGSNPTLGTVTVAQWQSIGL